MPVLLGNDWDTAAENRDAARAAGPVGAGHGEKRDCVAADRNRLGPVRGEFLIGDRVVITVGSRREPRGEQPVPGHDSTVDLTTQASGGHPGVTW